jgi:hypothetical protein
MAGQLSQTRQHLQDAESLVLAELFAKRHPAPSPLPIASDRIADALPVSGPQADWFRYARADP